MFGIFQPSSHVCPRRLSLNPRWLALAQSSMASKTKGTRIGEFDGCPGRCMALDATLELSSCTSTSTRER